MEMEDVKYIAYKNKKKYFIMKQVLGKYASTDLLTTSDIVRIANNSGSFSNTVDNEYIINSISETIINFNGVIYPHAKPNHYFNTREDAEKFIDNFLNPLIVAQKIIK